MKRPSPLKSALKLKTERGSGHLQGGKLTEETERARCTRINWRTEVKRVGEGNSWNADGPGSRICACDTCHPGLYDHRSKLVRMSIGIAMPRCNQNGRPLKTDVQPDDIAFYTCAPSSTS